MESNNILTSKIGKINPMSIDDYINLDGYQDLKKALSMNPNDIISEIKISKLTGRGGADFLFGIKLESVRNKKDIEKYVICNADEGEPGNFKDKYLMENDPHQLIEGMIISSYVVGASKAYIYIRGEYEKARCILENAILQARERNFLGKNIMGSTFDYDIEIRSGAGSYVCGEEFALIESIEGNRGKPREKPPFPTECGIFNKPTLLNNVETLCNIPFIIKHGGYKFASVGTSSSKGTRLVSLSGNVVKPGVYEVPYGTSIRYVIETLGQGVLNSGKIKMVCLGGASGPIITPEMIDLKIDNEELKKEGISIGSGAIIIIDERFNLFDILRNNIEFFEHESCGKCTPCREGIRQVAFLIKKFRKKKATKEDLELLETLINVIRDTSFCGLGFSSMTSIITSLKYFKEEYESSINKL